MVGVFAFWIRLRVRMFYGVTEVAAGLVVALWQVQNVEPGKPVLEFGPLLAMLTAGVYLVVRGLDNVYTAWNAEKPDRFARMFGRKDAPTEPAAAPPPPPTAMELAADPAATVVNAPGPAPLDVSRP
ncbi:MAG: hypothetical protein HS128_03005 [Ideonella sp.]|nr:hypothetical protein [Ideonella sp.]